jgi:hypothetical protein
MSWYTKAQAEQLKDLQVKANELFQKAALASNSAIDFTAKVKTENITEYYAVRKAVDDVRYGLAEFVGILNSRITPFGG